MNKGRVFLIAVLAFTVFVASAQAQRKSTRRPASKPAKTTVATTAAANAEVRAAKIKVANQLYNVADFNYKLGGIATGLEDMDAGARQKPLRGNALATHNNNKRTVVELIHNLQVGMAALEVEFRTKPNLKRFQFQVGGISDLVGQSESLASNGQFKNSGKMLLQVIQKLSDTLVAMP